MKSLEEIKKILVEHENLLRKKYKVKEIGIFGSYVKCRQNEGSDLDMIVEFEEKQMMGAFEYIGLLQDLEEYLHKIVGVKPHLASKSHGMSSNKWKYIENDIVYVFKGYNSKKLEKILKQIKTHPKVVAIFLFGSHAKGIQKPISDVDIAVVLKDQTSQAEADIGSLYSEKIDIVLFHRLPLYIQFEVLKYGKEIFNRDDTYLLETKRKLLREYLETVPLYRKVTAEALR